MEMHPGDHLIAAAIDGDLASVDELIRHDPGLRSYRNMFGASALHAAHFGGNAAIEALLRPDRVDIFLAAELGEIDTVDAELRDLPEQARELSPAGSTALHGACYWGQVTAAERLLDAGADATTPTRDSFLQISPLGSAIATTPGVPQPSDDEDTVLALVRLLLEHGADPNARRTDGTTPLHAAAWRGLTVVVQELLDAGADRTIAGRSGPHTGQIPADMALSQGHLILAVRLDAGTPDVRPPYG
jgi:cytohesin